MAVARDHDSERYTHLAAATHRLESLVETLRLSLRGRGMVTRAEIDYVVGAVKPISDVDVYNAFEKAGLKVATAGPNMTVVSKVNFDKVDRLVHRLGKSDLYEFLGRPPTAALQDLVEQAHAEYARVDTKPERSTERELTHQLVGEARAILKSASHRRAYDDHLAALKLAALREHILLVALRGTRISSKNFKLLNQRGMIIGNTSSEHVNRYMRHFLQKNNIVIYKEKGRLLNIGFLILATIAGMIFGQIFLADRSVMSIHTDARQSEPMRNQLSQKTVAKNGTPAAALTTRSRGAVAMRHQLSRLPPLLTPNEVRQRPIVKDGQSNDEAEPGP